MIKRLQRFINAFRTALRADTEEMPAQKSAWEKGEEFEHYIVSLFDRRHFSIKEMRSDKGADGRFPESNRYPDLLLEYKHRGECFAVECKWRSRWWSMKSSAAPYIEWTGAGEIKGKQKIDIYRQYGREKGVPVFVAIGIGGEPSSPEELYIAPLERMRYPRAKRCYLQRFSRPADRNFFFDPERKHLK